MRRTARLGLVAVVTLAGCGGSGSSRHVAASRGATSSSVTALGEATTLQGPATTEVPTTGSAPTVSAPAPTTPPTTAALPPTSASPPTTAVPTSPTTAVPTTAPAGSAPGAYGLVTAGPSCPVERQGQPCPPNPVSGARVDAQAGDGHVVASAQTSANGGYSLLLAPGRYTLVVSTGSTYPRCPPTPVTVASGAATRADITCDSGIR